MSEVPLYSRFRFARPISYSRYDILHAEAWRMACQPLATLRLPTKRKNRAEPSSLTRCLDLYYFQPHRSACTEQDLQRDHMAPDGADLRTLNRPLNMM